MCQGDVARRSAEFNPINPTTLSVYFLPLSRANKDFVRRNNKGIVSAPKKAEANLTEKILSPKIFINNAETYEYPAGV